MDTLAVLGKSPCALSKTLQSRRHAVSSFPGGAQTLSFLSHRHLAALPPSPFLSHSSCPTGAKARAGRTRTGIFLPHLVAAMVRPFFPFYALDSVKNGKKSMEEGEEVEETYIMVKPDGVQRGLVGEIISRFEKKGFLLKGLKLFQCPKELAEPYGSKKVNFVRGYQFKHLGLESNFLSIASGSKFVGLEGGYNDLNESTG
ncbi:putative Nucleoside diphosphate kinase 2, chloroplastic [Cocos nucifera]|uniref:nucleoside-diphosphate kinase n=1 Tax=Cocos nucifera TaxID=13894 RepID=A0A8K0IHT1_COCNU|nr:putative Nucleoside diphosphate kinase 2, chloroplastic [Cocos nucifera]